MYAHIFYTKLHLNILRYTLIKLLSSKETVICFATLSLRASDTVKLISLYIAGTRPACIS